MCHKQILMVCGGGARARCRCDCLPRSASTARFKELKLRGDDYQVVVIEGRWWWMCQWSIQAGTLPRGGMWPTLPPHIHTHAHRYRQATYHWHCHHVCGAQVSSQLWQGELICILHRLHTCCVCVYCACIHKAPCVYVYPLRWDILRMWWFTQNIGGCD